MKKRVILFILFVLILSFVTVPAFADNPADLTHTFDANNTSNVVLCGGGASSPSCNGLSYLLLTYNNLSTFNSNYYLSYKTSGSSNNYRIGLNQYVQTDSIYIPNLTYLELNAPSSSLWTDNPSGSISVVFSASNGCAACPTPEPCPDPVEAPYFVQLVIDAFWKYHVAFAGGAVAILAIFLFYRIVKGRLR